MICLLLWNNSVQAQTFFESATGDGVINFAKQTSGETSQFKLGLSTSAISYQYNYTGGNLAARNYSIFSFEISAKPNDNSLATFVKQGQLQPGFKLNAAIGHRWKLGVSPFQALDIYGKPQFSFDSYDIYDSTRVVSGQDPVYKARKATYGGSLLVNYVFMPGPFNIYLGGELNLLSGNNSDALADGNVETITSYPGSATKILATDITAVKKGQLTQLTTMPLKIDFMLDPGLVVSKADPTNNMTIGFFGYYRGDVHIDAPINRIGLGICFLGNSDPSKIYTSLGFELPTWGKGVSADDQKTNKGLVFATIGYTIK